MSEEALNGHEEWSFKLNPWITMVPLMLSIFMYALDETISNVALPYMAGTFSVSHNESTWIITSYLVASGIAIPAVDFFSNLIGRKQYFMLSIVVFTIASIFCGISNSMTMMLFSRILQGVGGGGIMPIAQAMIFEIFPKEKLSAAMAISLFSFLTSVYIQIKKSKTHTGLIDLSVLKNHNFLIGTMGQIVLMGVMMSSASILPSMLQSLLGYTSFLSGISMVPRGAGCFLASILCGIFVSKVGIKPVVTVGLIVLASAGLLFGEINTSISLVDIAFPNFVFGLGMIMAMVPLANISCATLPNEAQTNASGVQNLLKNIGAAIGTSIATTMITRFSQMHQHMMIKSLTETNSVYAERLNSMISSFITQVDLPTATHMAQAQIHNILRQQATLWGYVETFRYFAVAVILILPFVCFLHDSVKAEKKQKQA